MICLLPVDQIESIEIMKVLQQVHFTVLQQLQVLHVSLWKKQIKKAIAGNVYMNIGTQVVAKENSTKINDFNQGFSLMVSLKSSIILLL
jgi:vitamin B12 transporter